MENITVENAYPFARDIAGKIVAKEMTEYAGGMKIWKDVIDRLGDDCPDDLWAFKSNASAIEDCRWNAENGGAGNDALIRECERAIFVAAEKLLASDPAVVGKPRFAVLKSAAHNFCHSFLSGINEVSGVLVCHEIRGLMKKKRVEDVEIDFLAKTIWPADISSERISLSLDYYCRQKLEDILRSHGCRREHLVELKAHLHMKKGGLFWFKRLYRFSSAYEVASTSGKRHQGDVKAFFDVDDSAIAVRLFKKHYVLMPRNEGKK